MAVPIHLGSRRKTGDRPEHLVDDKRSPLLGAVAAGAIAAAVLLLLMLEVVALPLAVHLLYVPVVLMAYLFGISGAVATGALLGTAVWAAAEPAGGAAALLPLTGYLLAGSASALLFGRVDARRRELVEAQIATLKNVALAAETEDSSPLEHCERIANNARQMGEALGLKPKQLQELYWAGLLHDIGKVTVPREILDKPGGLTLEEYLVMRRHARLGANLLSSLGSFGAVSEAVGTHHERWDGSGYPGGLKGGQIPLYGRILAVVDVFEALTSDRPYRRALSAEEALADLQLNAGTHFDPELVVLLEKLFREGLITTSRQAVSDEEQPRLGLDTHARHPAGPN